MVSPNGTDGPQCLNYSAKTACKTLSYPITQGFSSLCLHSTFYNKTEDLRILYQKDINIFCKECLLINSEITLFCQGVEVCTLFIRDVFLKNSTMRFSGLFINFYNVTLEQPIIQNSPDYRRKDNYRLLIENSTLSCLELGNCGLYLTNLSSAKVILVKSYLTNFRLHLDILAMYYDLPF